MKKTISIIAALLFSVCGSLQADTSFLLIQGPFGTGGAVETFKLAINYTPGTISSGFDLLTSALSSNELQYSVHPTWGASLNGFTFDGTSLQNDYVVTNTWWNYYTADPTGSAWSYSDMGATSRTLSNGSFDGWVFGTSTFDPTTWEVTYATPIDGAENAPLASNFAGATQVEAVPEPGSLALAFTGGALAVILRRKFRKS